MTKPKKGKYQNRDVYLNAAFDLIRDRGVDKLTMRKVAEYLDVSPMAIYKHFSNKDELLKAVLDEFIARADVLPEADLPWDQWLTQVAEGMFRTLQGEVSWLPLLGAFEVGDNALEVTLRFMQKLMAAGFGFQQALEAYLAMLHLVIGAVTLQSTMQASMEKSELLLGRLSSAVGMPVGELPHTIQQNQINMGLPLLVEALRGRLAQNQTS